ncbi:hypothetical protein CDL15_Pgr010686 [Punica granatum]|uniref:Uncharacterized protein n=1 Tax=Punica granatum TaxID=22663 RepID=A0A218XN55_PUNGR|nr:hypothetical protein CDL15_Pgr010686 [Punica granatum]PKI61035.1 hypothetical protein CRG98_018597 [Punica granatum]
MNSADRLDGSWAERTSAGPGVANWAERAGNGPRRELGRRREQLGHDGPNELDYSLDRMGRCWLGWTPAEPG